MVWLDGWKKRIKLTVDNTNVDGDLSNFPILIKISNSSGITSTNVTSIFTELGSDVNRKKIAVTTSDGETQCYVEIERFDYSNSVAELWVKVPTVVSGTATDLYLYYDNSKSDNTTYVGDITDIPAQNVWDSNFKFVMHMAQNPNGDVADAIKDSTSNAIHATPVGSMTSADLVDGKIGKAIDFDESDDYLKTPSADDALNITDTLTIEAIIKPSYTLDSGLSVGKGICSRAFIPNLNQDSYFLLINTDGKMQLGTYGGNIQGTKTSWLLNTSFYVAGTYNSTGLIGDLFVDSVKESLTVDSYDSMAGTTNSLVIATYSALNFFPGIIDEVRISNIVRSDAWVKATYYSNWDDLASYGIAVEYSLEVILPSPFSATASLQSNIQIELVPGILSAESSISVDEIFWGSFVECPSPFGATSTLQAKTSLEVAINPFIGQTNLQGSIQIELVPPSFEAQSELSIGEIFRGYLVDLPEPFSADASLQANTQIEIVTAPLIATSALLSNIGIEVSAGVLSATGAILANPVYPIILTGAKRIYLFTLTGAADGVDDIIIPISSFQSRIKSGDPTSLSVVIPGTEYASAINARLNGDLIIRMGYQNEDEILLTEIVSRVLFENIIIYEGPTNKSITLDGHRTATWTPKAVSLENASYRNLTKGKLRYRCKPDLYLRPGDTANVNDDSFTVKSITYSVSPMLETYEIAE